MHLGGAIDADAADKAARPLRRARQHPALGRVYVPANLYANVGDRPAELALRMHLAAERGISPRLGVTGGLLAYQLGPRTRTLSLTSNTRVLLPARAGGPR